MTNTCVVRHAKDKGSRHIFVHMCQHKCMLHICTYHNYTNIDGWMGRYRYIADINESLYIVCMCVYRECVLYTEYKCVYSVYTHHMHACTYV